MIDILIETVKDLAITSGLYNLSWQQGIMLAISLVLMYLAIAKGYEPVLLLPIAFGMMLTNLPLAELYHPELFAGTELDIIEVVKKGGLVDFLYLGVKLGIFPPLKFLGIGCMTDFGPLIANPKSFLLGAAAQFGIFGAFLGTMALSPLLGYTYAEAGAISIIGGADGPTAIFVTGNS